MKFDDRPADGQSHTHATFLGGEERLNSWHVPLASVLYQCPARRPSYVKVPGGKYESFLLKDEATTYAKKIGGKVIDFDRLAIGLL